MLTWQQQEVYENAEEIKTQALEMHTRLKKFYDDFFKKIGTDLSRAVKAYSSGVRSWESRVMPSIRKIEEMITTGKAPFPAERTLIVSGALESCLQSRHQGNVKLDTPHLSVKYTPPAESQHARA